MLRLRRPTSQTLAEIAAESRADVPTYPEIGATLTGSLPIGYVHDDRAVPLGSGPDIFEAARTTLQNWAAHRGAGLVMSDGAEVKEGSTVALAAPLTFGYAIATCRIVGVVDEADRYGFAYGTLPFHPEQGEEAFIVERTGQDVHFRIAAFSRPRFWAARLARPMARRLQLKALDAYLSAMQAQVHRTPDSGLLHFRSPDHVAIISGETQVVVQIPVKVIESLAAEERPTLRTVGTPAWFAPEPVRAELLLVQQRVSETDRETVEAALSEAEYACRYGTGVAVIPASDM